ncbi:hypothetical protein [Flavobacterium sp. 3HN19-14]|uniref:hypothetical protein n=1 Tax=Flavobacterium sp. 3HN19-14 TaxID=3448133 RepID=UPI003EDF9EF9
MTYGMLRVVGTLSNSTAPLVPNGTYRIGRYRFTNTTTWAVSSNAQLWVNTGNFGGSTNAIVSGLKNGTSTPAYAYTPTAPAASPGVALGYTQAAPLSLLLNPAPCSLTTTWNGNAWAPFAPIATQAAVIDGNYSSTGPCLPVH